MAEKKYRFMMIPAFRLRAMNVSQPKEQRLKSINFDYDALMPLLEDVDFDLDEGTLPTYGDWPVENREEFCYAATARLPAVRKACESGKYNALILLGGGEPGFFEAKEIARKFNIPVTSCGFSQMHVASLLGNKFSVIDLAESHNMFYYNLVVQHGFTQKCASIRSINYPLPRPGHLHDPSLRDEQAKAMRGEQSETVDRAVEQSVAAIEEDGAEVIIFGCSGTFWLQPFLQKRLNEIGWEIPVMDAYACTITLAKLMVDLGVNASGLTFPGDRPKKWRKKKTF